jgi:hypothetical protein
MKNNTRRYASLELRLAGSWVGGVATAFFDLQLGTVAQVTGTATATIVPAGNGWYRVSITATTTAAPAATPFRVGLCSTGTVNTYTGDGVSSNFFWGAGIEPGAFPSSYIPTAGVSATRAAEVASMPVGSWYSSVASTLGVEAQQLSQHNQAVAVLCLEQATTNRTSINVAGGNFITGFDTLGPLNFGAVTPPAGSVWKAAFGFTNGAQAIVVNGSPATSATVATLTGSITKLEIGSVFNLQQFNGYIRRVRYWSRMLSNSEMQAATI